jgi:hypothetical protein
VPVVEDSNRAGVGDSERLGWPWNCFGSAARSDQDGARMRRINAEQIVCKRPPVAEHSFQIGVIQAEKKCQRTTQHVWHIPLTAFEGQLPLGRWLVSVEGSASQ